MGFGDRTPSKSAPARAHQNIPHDHFVDVNHAVVREMEAGGPTGGDGTAFSESEHDRWVDHRTGETNQRKSRVKVRTIVDTTTRATTDFLVAGKKVGDTSGLPLPPDDERLKSRIAGAPALFDSAYLTYEVLRRPSLLGAIPFIKPKSNTRPDGGDQTRRDMMERYGSDPDGFFWTYNRRNIVESVFGALKRMYGNSVKCRKPVS